MNASLGARLGLSFTLECRDKDGNILKTIDCKGSIPLEESGLTIKQAQELIDEQGANHGADDCK